MRRVLLSTTDIPLRDAAGFDSTVRWYYNRIVALLARIWSYSDNVLPVNRSYVNEFAQSNGIWTYVDSILAGIQDTANYQGSDRRFNLWTKKFRSYVDAEESRMYDVLQQVNHHIDDENTLTLVVGRARPEQV